MKTIFYQGNFTVINKIQCRKYVSDNIKTFILPIVKLHKRKTFTSLSSFIALDCLNVVEIRNNLKLLNIQSI